MNIILKNFLYFDEEFDWPLWKNIDSYSNDLSNLVPAFSKSYCDILRIADIFFFSIFFFFSFFDISNTNLVFFFFLI